ncbi:MAG TPA: flotillin domain-containing protein [Polyangiaceae bacterium]|nr:flotillin domain-containing protein [Polyangiaceae bacterium]
MNFNGFEVWQVVLAIVGAIVLVLFVFFASMARFLKRPSPSEAIIRIGRNKTDVFIGQACWIVPVLHRSSTISLSTIGLTIRRASHDALVTKDYISTNLSAEFYIRVEPNDDDVKKAARTIGIDEGHASSDAIRVKSQQLLEPKLVGALRAVAAQNDFLALHLNREHFALEVSNALREDLGRNGFTLESVTITELTQTPLSEMRADDIFGASGRQTVTNTVVEKNIAVKRKVQEEAERTAEIAREQEINVAMQNRMTREGKAKEEEAAIKAELAKSEAIEARDLQRQSNISVERAKKEQTEQAAEIGKQKVIEAAQVDKERTIEAALVDKQITLTLKAKESAEADAQKAAALALREKADQEVVTVARVSEAERLKRIAIVDAEKRGEQEKIAAEVEAFKKKVDADGIAAAQRASATGTAEAARFRSQGEADAVKIKAKADADAAELQAMSITRLAEAQREAGLKEAEVLREKIMAQNAKSREILIQETLASLIQNGPALVHELMKPAERIGEIKVLNLTGGLGGGNNMGTSNGTSPGQLPLLGNALGPIAKTMLETSAMMPLLKEVMKFANMDTLKGLVPPNAVASPPTPSAIARPPNTARTFSGQGAPAASASSDEVFFLDEGSTK